MKHLRRYLLIIILSSGVGFTTSCTVWDMIKPSSGLSVDTEIVAGDKTQTVHTELGQTSNTADKIQIENNNVDYVTLGLLLLSVATGVVGWMLPVPKWMRKNEE